jgi:hypothetical protein
MTNIYPYKYISSPTGNETKYGLHFLKYLCIMYACIPIHVHMHLHKHARGSQMLTLDGSLPLGLPILVFEVKSLSEHIVHQFNHTSCRDSCKNLIA